MNEQAAMVQIVINTLEILNIPATYDNVNHLTGIYKTLYQLRDGLAGTAAAKPAPAEETGAGTEEAEKDG